MVTRQRARLMAAAAIAGTVSAFATAATAAADEPVEAGITVPVVEGLSADFMNGVDASSILSLEESGVTFRDFDGEEADVFDVFADAGVNYSRIRVWNDPYDADGNGYGGGTVDAERATEIGLRSTAAGMRVFVDFHYSDFWAHPGQQPLPKAWEGMTTAERADAMYDYTVDTLSRMDDAGVDVGMVQIGNENSGLLLAETAWPESGQLFDAASRGVRDALGDDVKIAIHFTNPERGNYGSLADSLATYDTDPATEGVQPIDYDVFASSYYAYWHGTLENLTSQLAGVAETYGKDVIVAETSWAYTLEDGDGYPNNIRTAYDQYSTSVQGQALAVRDVIEAVAKVGDAGLGVFYWEPAWLPVGPPEEIEQNRLLWEEFGSGWASSHAADYSADAAANYGGSGWDNQAMFDFEGRPLESLRVWDYVRYGTVGPRDVDTVASPEITVVDGQSWSLPETVAVSYTDGTTEQQDVTWQGHESWFVGAGTYEVPGTTDAGLESTLTVTVLDGDADGQNLLANPGFEDGVAPWTGTGTGYTISATDDPFAGTRSTHWYRAGGDFSFTISQEITGVAAGDYRLSAQAQGRAAVAGEATSISLASGIESASAPFTLSGYEGWQNPRTPIVTVAEGQSVTVSATFSLKDGAWGTIDEFELVEVTPVVEADTSALEAVYTEGAAIDRDGWTAASLLAFDRAMTRAEVILDASSPSQASVDAAAAALRTAIDDLEAGDGSIPDPTVRTVELTVVDGEPIDLPDEVTVVAYDDSTTTEAVTWNDGLDAIAGPGTYTVTGVTENGWTARAEIVVTARNEIANGGFEKGIDDVTPWTIEADPWPEDEGSFWVTASAGSDGDEGEYALNYYVDGQPYAFTALQDVDLPAGTYDLWGRIYCPMTFSYDPNFSDDPDSNDSVFAYENDSFYVPLTFGGDPAVDLDRGNGYGSTGRFDGAGNPPRANVRDNWVWINLTDGTDLNGLGPNSGTVDPVASYTSAGGQVTFKLMSREGGIRHDAFAFVVDGELPTEEELDEAVEASKGTLRFTAISVDPETNEVSLTWASRSGISYILNWSRDLATDSWIEIDDNVTSQGETTTFVVPAGPAENPNPAEEPRLYFQVSEP